MPKGKTPGPDGISPEFYSIFKDLTIPLLNTIYQHACTYGELPTEFLNGNIVLIPKASDPTSLHAKCPITLLNSYYKIFTKLWQLRLAKAIESLITWNQTTFLQGHSIHHTILLCNEVLHHACTNDLSTVFLKLNFKKAFDSLQWDFLQSLFRSMGFGDMFDLVL